MTTLRGLATDSSGSPAVGRKVRAYRMDTGALLGEAITIDNPATSGLVHRYTMDNITGGTTLVDEQGTSSGTISGATTVAGVNGNALSFNGSSNSVNLGASMAAGATGSITVCAWVKNSSAGNAVYLSKYAAVPCFFELGKNTDSFYFRIGASGSANAEIFDPSLVSSYGANYVFLIGEYDASVSKLRIYANNVQKAESTTARNASRTSDVAYMGRRAFSGAETYGAAAIDNVRVFNRVLTANEKTALFLEKFSMTAGEYLVECGSYAAEVIAYEFNPADLTIKPKIHISTPV